jgi:tRNA(Ile)-lysidine synthase
MAGGRQQDLLAKRVLGFIQEHQLVSNQHRLLVAVSGGPDSVCLLHILVELQNKLGIKLHVAHLNHQLRGAESEADSQYVVDLAHHLGIPATMEQRDVKTYQARQRLSLEEAAREVRYAFLAQVAESIGASRVAVGHTADDHIETILMHLIRGTGTRGLRGLEPSTEWRSKLTITRPLLLVSREETASYCAGHQLVPRLDASNLSLSPLRNRIRQQLLPLLESYNPGVAEALFRTARIAADDIAYLDSEIARLWSEIVRQQENAIVLEKERFCQLSPALKRHLLRAAIERLSGNLKDIEMSHIDEIMAALAKPAGKRINLPGGLGFFIEYDGYLLAPDPAALFPFPPLEAQSSLRIPGETRLPGWHIEAAVIDPSVVKWKTEGERLIDNIFIVYLDRDKTGDKLLVRSRQSGDRFQPLGMSQPKKLGEFMIDAKIPHAWRERIPLVCSPSHILWVVGWRLDERVKVTPSTKRILRLEFKRC